MFHRAYYKGAHASVEAAATTGQRYSALSSARISIALGV